MSKANGVKQTKIQVTLTKQPVTYRDIHSGREKEGSRYAEAAENCCISSMTCDTTIF